MGERGWGGDGGERGWGGDVGERGRVGREVGEGRGGEGWGGRYRPGRDNENPADYLSRHPDQPASTDPVENTVSYICTSSVPKAVTLQEVEQHYLHDSVMQKLSHAIQSGQWTDEEVTPYLRIQDELAVYTGIVLRHTRIVLPFSLRERAVELAYRGHQGVVKTKSLL